MLKPNFVAGLDHFSASHEGPYGTITSSWARKKNGIEYTVVIPANSTASLAINLPSNQRLYLNEKIINQNTQLVAGKYQFVIK